MWQGAERLFEVSHGLAVGRARYGLPPGLSEVRQRLVPHLAPQGMVCQVLDLLGQAVGTEMFESLHNAGMQRPPALVENAAVGHLVGEGVLEGIFSLGKELRLI